MINPVIKPRVEESRRFACRWVCAIDFDPFVSIAVRTSKCKIVEVIRSAATARKDMVNRKRGHLALNR
jgi:hypothetical protein